MINFREILEATTRKDDSNCFSRTSEQVVALYYSDNLSLPIQVAMQGDAEGGFYNVDGRNTVYRRNYLKISVCFQLSHPSRKGAELVVLINKNPVKITSFQAIASGVDDAEVLKQYGPKRDKEEVHPLVRQFTLPSELHNSIMSYERIQFKTNGKGGCSQHKMAITKSMLQFKLYAELEDGRQLLISTLSSTELVLRGRSQKYYDSLSESLKLEVLNILARPFVPRSASKVNISPESVYANVQSESLHRSVYPQAAASSNSFEMFQAATDFESNSPIDSNYLLSPSSSCFTGSSSPFAVNDMGYFSTSATPNQSRSFSPSSLDFYLEPQFQAFGFGQNQTAAGYTDMNANSCSKFFSQAPNFMSHAAPQSTGPIYQNQALQFMIPQQQQPVKRHVKPTLKIDTLHLPSNMNMQRSAAAVPSPLRNYFSSQEVDSNHGSFVFPPPSTSLDTYFAPPPNSAKEFTFTNLQPSTAAPLGFVMHQHQTLEYSLLSTSSPLDQQKQQQNFNF